MIKQPLLVNFQINMQQISFKKPVIGLCAYSGSGKTTLLEKLLPIFNSHSLEVAVIKHAHHSFDIDHPEKDSYKIRKAGAQQMLISSQNRWALIHEHANGQHELHLEDALEKIDAESIDFVIVEGFKKAAIPKIEIYRPALGKPLISSKDQHVIAIATDGEDVVDTKLPLLDLNQPFVIAAYIEQLVATNK